MAKRIPPRNYFASIRHFNGGSSWAHVRTHFGRKVAYAMIAKHIEGDGKIESFRDDETADHYDHQGLAEGSDGTLRKPESSLTGNESRYYGPF